MTEDTITMAHGSGGSATGQLIQEIFAEAFSNDTLNRMEDAAVLPEASGRLAMTTDSFVVTPLEYRGGDIGRLAVCGTVNDLLMRGAVPAYLTCGWILEEGTSIDQLRRIVQSMAKTAKEAGVSIVAGDTKVIEGGRCSIYINTTGVGFVPDQVDIAAGNAKDGDVILVSGTLGEHHAAILSERMSIENQIKSDTAPLTEMVGKLRGMPVHTLRDVTRGGLATVCKELAEASGQTFVLQSSAIPVQPEVRDFCGLLGLDPLYMGNEGKLVCILPKEWADQALEAMRSSAYGQNAAIIGRVKGMESGQEQGIKQELSPWQKPGALIMETEIGGIRELDVLQGEGLPRIC